jgi:hypothetical protein
MEHGRMELGWKEHGRMEHDWMEHGWKEEGRNERRGKSAARTAAGWEDLEWGAAGTTRPLQARKVRSTQGGS